MRLNQSTKMPDKKLDIMTVVIYYDGRHNEALERCFHVSSYRKLREVTGIVSDLASHAAFKQSLRM